ncbi:hypothetical protein WMF31_04560 [Sorangium sp. So ce1036]|uniref:hypothetical protein n=1 Tax=Sorangium sp. So ce1036 TaxID=3133328 RepID=UPI003F048434
MRRLHWASGALAIMSLAAGLQALGCFPLDYTERDQGVTPGSGSAGGEAPPEPRCVPGLQEGPDASCGIFVSVEAGPEGDGSKERPFNTLAAAIDAAAGREPGQRRIYACVGTFTEKVVLSADGIEVYGSLACDQEWRLAEEDRRTTLSAGPDEIPLTIVGGGGSTRLEGLEVVAQPAARLGGSSIAVVAEKVKLELVRCTLQAGDAKHGESPDNYEMDAQPGRVGGDGAPACSALSGAGGISDPLECGEDVTVGGIGGQGAPSTAGQGNPGSPEGATNTGGIGQRAAAFCSVGGPGGRGQDGAPGEGAVGLGQITRSGYKGVDGANGARGRPGEGGGGGGASRGRFEAARCPAMGPTSGAGGGAGGTGGCGGLGGRGGQAGGSSIALISLASELRFQDVTLVAGKGGNGGAGQHGQIGGAGAEGGKGGDAPDGLQEGCAGGMGGHGGAGGDGGGGTGGHSLAIAFKGMPVPPSEGQGFTAELGEPGAGGPGFQGRDGATGNRAIALGFDE